MKTLKLPLLGILLLTAAIVRADSPPVLNVVGYINRPVVAGDNLVANQLWTTNNSLNYIFASSTVADGSTFTKWDPLTMQFLPLSVFDVATTTWSINYTLELGEGGLLHSPEPGTNTFVGEVRYWDWDGGIVGWEPNYADGFYLISCPVPLGGATFQQVTGREPRDGEWVSILDEVTQSYSATTFHAGLGWDNGIPGLAVGRAAWFNLGPVVVPEPSSAGLLAMAAAVAWLRRRR